jgi:peptidoglycan/xylan/chitin deacetylase (PgdA/CDA1 family)
MVRIGYDLLHEIRNLLIVGQPSRNANMPALELHIAFLRDLITGAGIPLVEIPPVPDGYRFIACLTHDVDHPSIRQHKCDHTMFGFLYRSVFVSLRNLMGGRIRVRDLVRNWAAVLKLPFIYLGLAKDFWSEFDDHYLELENDLRSTFFVIPFKNCSGKNSHGPAPMFRAARYGAADIADTIRKLRSAGSEVGLHGIDAWCDSVRGRAELEEIRRATGVSTVGVRMHWLYYDQYSAAALEKAGAAYDSTVGYNETVGYRAGTTQAYKPLEATRLLELPLHVMDTALFYPAHLGFSPRQARTVLGRMADNAVQFGGCLTVNWHDRSLAPERLWDTSYRDLLQDIRNRGAWFATAGQAIAWFQKRRSVVFETDCMSPDTVRARVSAHESDHLPGLRLRVHKVRQSCGTVTQGPAAYVDLTFDESAETRCADFSENAERRVLERIS